MMHIRVALLGAATLALVGCGKIDADGDAGPETGPDVAVVDTGPDVSVWQCGWNFDAGLNLHQGPQVVTCDDATKAACQAWAQSLVQEGTVYWFCDDVGHECQTFGNNCQMQQGYWICSCDNNACPYGNNKVCVSDTPNGAKHCVPPCSQ